MTSASSEILNISGTQTDSIGSGNFILIGDVRSSPTKALEYKTSKLVTMTTK
jgi:hypothetical protein